MKAILKAPAKINICLKVNKKNDDGYHDLTTIMQRISLYDIIEVSILKQKNAVNHDMSEQINITCNFPYIPTNDKNLIYKIIEYIYDKHNIHDRIKVYLKKMIPTGAGLGGGSSDAASILLYLNKYYKLKYTLDELSQIALQFGSDIPFFLYKKECICSGRGEIVKEVPQYGNYYVLIVAPDIRVSTKEVYEKFDSVDISDIEKNIKDEKINNLLYAFKTHNRKLLVENMFNDLELVTERELGIITVIKKKMMENKAMVSMMSGSGSTVFGLFKDIFSAKKCKKLLKNEYENAFVFISKPVMFL